MSRSEFAAQLRVAIELRKARGFISIPCDHLIKVLKEVEASPDSEPNQFVQARFEHALNQSRNVYQAVIATGQSAIKSLFLINGGAAVAMLAFIGHMIAVAPDQVDELAHSLVWFAYGVLVAALCSGFTYLCNYAYAGEKWWHQIVGHVLRWVTWALWFGSIFLFFSGVAAAYDTFWAFGHSA